MEWISARELFGNDPIIAEIVAGFIELDDDGQKLVLDFIDIIKKRREEAENNKP